MNIPADWDNRPPPSMGRRNAVFRPDHGSFGKFIKSEQMRKPTAEVAGAVMLVARANTPRSSRERGKGGSPHMQDRWSVKREAGFLKVDRAFRVRVIVQNSDPESALVEFGSKNNKRRRMLGSAGALFGDLKFKGKEGIR